MKQSKKMAYSGPKPVKLGGKGPERGDKLGHHFGGVGAGKGTKSVFGSKPPKC